MSLNPQKSHNGGITKSSKFWLAVLVAGIVMNMLDFVVQGMWLEKAVYSSLPDLFNAAGNPIWHVVGDFVAVLVLAWVYDKVSGSFSVGAGGGATFGLYAGILVNFPTWIFTHLMFKGFPYSLSWIWTVLGIIWTVIAGAVIAAIYKKSPPAAV